MQGVAAADGQILPPQPKKREIQNVSLFFVIYMPLKDFHSLYRLLHKLSRDED